VPARRRRRALSRRQPSLRDRPARGPPARSLTASTQPARTLCRAGRETKETVAASISTATASCSSTRRILSTVVEYVVGDHHADRTPAAAASAAVSCGSAARAVGAERRLVPPRRAPRPGRTTRSRAPAPATIAPARPDRTAVLARATITRAHIAALGRPIPWTGWQRRAVGLSPVRVASHTRCVVEHPAGSVIADLRECASAGPDRQQQRARAIFAPWYDGYRMGGVRIYSCWMGEVGGSNSRAGSSSRASPTSGPGSRGLLADRQVGGASSASTRAGRRPTSPPDHAGGADLRTPHRRTLIRASASTAVITPTFPHFPEPCRARGSCTTDGDGTLPLLAAAGDIPTLRTLVVRAHPLSRQRSRGAGLLHRGHGDVPRWARPDRFQRYLGEIESSSRVSPAHASYARCTALRLSPSSLEARHADHRLLSVARVPVMLGFDPGSSSFTRRTPWRPAPRRPPSRRVRRQRWRHGHESRHRRDRRMANRCAFSNPCSALSRVAAAARSAAMSEAWSCYRRYGAASPPSA